MPAANLYGEYDLQTFEWTDGVLSKVMREICVDEKPDEKWILLDGPVDTLWIESMNTVRLALALNPSPNPSPSPNSNPPPTLALPFTPTPNPHQVLDDNKLLTLINGERIAMPPQVCTNP